MRRSAALALALCLVVAGCAAPTSDGGQAPLPGAPDVTYEGGSLPSDAGTVFARVQSVLGTNVTPPNHVRIVTSPDALAGNATPEVPRFWRIAGVTAESGLSEDAAARLANGRATALGSVVVYPGANATAADRVVLAHEFVHFVQFATRADVRVTRTVPVRTTDGQFVRRSVVEGAAVFATDAYVETYAPEQDPNAAVYARLNQTLAPGSLAWHGIHAYIEGREYVAARVDDPRALDAVYARPPNTSEQLIHGLPPGSEPPRALNASVAAPGPWRVTATDRLGEALVRSALAGHVGVGRASAAAAGWGTDRLYTFRRPDAANASYAWVLRWDDAANATEFAGAMRDALDARATDSGDGWWRVAGVRVETVRATPTATVLVAGSPSFVESATVRGDGGNVTVRVG
jgi:hypothetical protein